jgi:WD40 repeat protein
MKDSKGFAPPPGPPIMAVLPGVLLPGGNVIAEGLKGGVVFWNMAAGKEGTIAHRFKPPEGSSTAMPPKQPRQPGGPPVPKPLEWSYTAMALSADGKTLIVGDNKHTIRVFDVATEKELRSFGVANVKGVGAMAVSPDGKRLVTVASGDGFLRLWDLEKGTEERTLTYSENSSWISSVLFTPDSRTILASFTVAVVNKTGSRLIVHTWDTASGKPGQTLTDDPYGDDPYTGKSILAVSPDSQTLAAMSVDGVIRLYDLTTGKEKHPVAASNSALKAVCFRPDGKTLTTFGSDYSLRDWEAITGRLLDAPRPSLQGSSVKFTADGRFLSLVKFTADGRFLSLSLGGIKEEKTVRLGSV